MKLTDFGLSRYYNMKEDQGIPISEQRSYSYCGTEQYMAVGSIRYPFHSSPKCYYVGRILKLLIGGPWAFCCVSVLQDVTRFKGILIM